MKITSEIKGKLTVLLFEVGTKQITTLDALIEALEVLIEELKAEKNATQS